VTRDVADALAHLSRRLTQVVAGHRRFAATRRQQRRQHAQRGRLAGAVRPQEAEDLAGLHAQVDPGDRLDAAAAAGKGATEAAGRDDVLISMRTAVGVDHG